MSKTLGEVIAISGYLQSLNLTTLCIWIVILAALLVMIILGLKNFARIHKWISGRMTSLKPTPSGNTGVYSEDIITSIDDCINAAGYTYDPKQDIFYSNIDAWQRKLGYCQLYDEASATLGMIIDCEPIYFNYGGKSWLIEFWKGQYDLTTGGEIGVYTADKTNINIDGIFNGTFYNSASDEELLDMSFYLFKNGKPLCERAANHWWLTGFKVGEFSEPSELVMFINITFKDEKMRDAFVKALMKAGYSRYEIIINGNRVDVKFNRTHTKQPYTRTKQTDWLIQRKNEELCKMYQTITKPYSNFQDKMMAIKEQAPWIYNQVLNMGKNKKLLDVFEKIKY